MNRRIPACLYLSALSLLAGCGANTKFAPPGTDNSKNTTTPIHHLIIVIGENRSFDHPSAPSHPPAQSQTVLNLLSEGIVKPDGTPGPNFQQAAQQQATDTP